MNTLLNSYGSLADAETVIARIRAFALKHGVRATARQFNFSLGTASAIKNNVGAITGKRLALWATKACISCPVLGSVEPSACREHAQTAHSRRARMVSNPDKIALYAACRKCQKGEAYASANGKQ